MSLRLSLVISVLALGFMACGSGTEQKMLTSFFASIYSEKSGDTLLSRMLPFFARDVREKRLPIHATKSRLSEKFRGAEVESWKESEQNGRRTVSGTLLEIPKDGPPVKKGFIARFAEQKSPDGKDSIWMLFDLVFSSGPIGTHEDWVRLVAPSPVARKAVEAITNKISILVFGRFSTDPVMHVLRELAACIPDRVTFSYHDPDIDRGLAATYGVSRTPHVVFENGNRRAVIAVGDLAWDEGRVEGQQHRVFAAERLLVNALVQIGGPVQHAWFVKGHGERDARGLKAAEMNRFATALSNSGYILTNASLGQALAASNQGVLLFADPRNGLAGDEDALLMQALETGKTRAFFLFDTPLPDQGITLAARFGFASVKATVVDPANKDSFRGARWIEALLQPHEAVRNFINRPNFRVLLAECAGFVPVAVKPTNFITASIISCSSNGWGETEFEEEKPDEFEFDAAKDIHGPLQLGFAVTTAGTNPRPAAVFFGDCDFIANDLLQSRTSNRLFAADLLDWLLRPAIHAIPARDYPPAKFKNLQ